MNAKIDVRVFAVEIAARILGAGTPDKDVVSKAQQIESYITNGITLPDTAAEVTPSELLKGIASMAAIGAQDSEIK